MQLHALNLQDKNATLHKACVEGDIEVAKYLVENGAIVQDLTSDIMVSLTLWYSVKCCTHLQIKADTKNHPYYWQFTVAYCHSEGIT